MVDKRGYFIAVLLGAAGGGLIVTLLTKAVPKMVSQIMSGMMRTMMTGMGENGCSPAEM